MSMHSKLIWLIVALILLNVLDMTTTYYALSLGAVETNPVMARGFASGYAVSYKVLGIVIGVGLTIWRIRRAPNMTRTYINAYTVFCFIYSLVIANNVLVILFARNAAAVMQ